MDGVAIFQWVDFQVKILHKRCFQSPDSPINVFFTYYRFPFHLPGPTQTAPAN